MLYVSHSVSLFYVVVRRLDSVPALRGVVIFTNQIILSAQTPYTLVYKHVKCFNFNFFGYSVSTPTMRIHYGYGI
ncbi:hypothetical protein SAMN05421579_16212 [Xenorhabdus japonica]|uniref:Uncharacterized protein n=2 Tax=Xenorhabdus TaxID=626 RepID=A0A2D0L7A3_9GAMM|nr:hypothetical protein Xkoz_02637 [Xenorhabdus kozodoii]SFO09057.1 hypothetical protein SAMN05421579_16212 [Xenorhabdus japonica]